MGRYCNSLTIQGGAAAKPKAIPFFQREQIHRQAHQTIGIEEEAAAIHTENAVIEILQIKPKRMLPDAAQQC